MNLRKLLTVVAVVLGGLMTASAVNAQTNYDFTFTGSDGSTYNGSLAGANGAYFDNTSSNGAFGFCPDCGGSLAVLTIKNSGNTAFSLPGMGLGGFGNQFSVNVSAYNASNTLLGTNTYNNYTQNTFGTASNNQAIYGPSYADSTYFTISAASDISGSATGDCICLNLGTVGALASAPVGAPEIDGSLAPKVGFLLGCLFLIFGRKNQTTEPMLIA